jgi:murein DD-endopeptidase MepM/ murein hydrolase activator NlpD
MKFNKLFFKNIIFCILSFLITACFSEKNDKGLFEIQYKNLKNKQINEIKTYFDGVVYLKFHDSYLKIFPKSNLKFEFNDFILNEGTILNINKRSKLLNKINELNVDEKIFFTNQIGNAQFFRIRLPNYIKNFENSIKIDYYIDDNKIDTVNAKLDFITATKFDNFYGFFIPLNLNWKTNNLIYTVDLSADSKKFNIKIVKKININMVPFQKDIVIFNAAKTKEFFRYNKKQIEIDTKAEFEIWMEDNPFLFFLSGYDYPVKGNFGISSLFGEERILKGYNGVIMSKNSHHNGIDIPKPKGELLYATSDGKIRFARYTELFGNAIIVENGFSVYSTFYHLSKIYVKVNDIVKKGDVLGEIGSTGDSTGPHLHWEVRIDGIPINPRSLFGIEDVLN